MNEKYHFSSRILSNVRRNSSLDPTLTELILRFVLRRHQEDATVGPVRHCAVQPAAGRAVGTVFLIPWPRLSIPCLRHICAT
jgi:hypothetical protein